MVCTSCINPSLVIRWSNTQEAPLHSANLCFWTLSDKFGQCATEWRYKCAAGHKKRSSGQCAAEWCTECVAGPSATYLSNALPNGVLNVQLNAQRHVRPMCCRNACWMCWTLSDTFRHCAAELRAESATGCLATHSAVWRADSANILLNGERLADLTHLVNSAMISLLHKCLSSY